MALTSQRMMPVTPQDKVFYQIVDGRIAEQRKSKGITQVQLAGKLGIAQQTKAHYEGGRLRIPLSLMPPLASELEIAISDLVEEQELKRGADLHQNCNDKLNRSGSYRELNKNWSVRC